MKRLFLLISSIAVMAIASHGYAAQCPSYAGSGEVVATSIQVGNDFPGAVRHEFGKRDARIVYYTHPNPELSKEGQLVAAAYGGDISTVAVLIGAGVDVNSQDVMLGCADGINFEKGSGMTALEWALYEGHLTIAKVLRANGARLDTYSGECMDPIVHHGNDNAEIMTWLLTEGADPNAVGSTRCSTHVLSTVVAKDALDVAEVLLAHGANPNANSAGGRSALSWAIVNSNAKAVELLLSKGADPNRRSLGGKPLQLAKSYDNVRIQELLTGAGATL